MVGVLLSSTHAAQAQVPQKVITDSCLEACSPQDVYAADLTGSGDLDVLSASIYDDKIAWYENNGDGTFSNQKIITTDATGAVSVYAVDLTGNDTPDVLSASGVCCNDGKIAWYENNGDGTFSGQKVITTNIDETNSGVYAADLTGGGAPDVLSALDGKIAWYENQGGGSFSAQKVITTDVNSPRDVYAADLTGNGQPDVLSASKEDDTIAWYENGGGFFSDQKVITTEADWAKSVYAADLTGSGDLDVLSASYSDDKIAWYENNGDGTFSDQKIITTDANEAVSVYAADLTGSGDPDVLSVSEEDNTIAWYENTKGVLPVELIGFSARADGTGARLTWQTASETNNAGFYVQHSPPSPTGGSHDGEVPGAWERLGFVEGAETTFEATTYRFNVEKKLAPGTHRFRLRQVDTDGTAHLSEATTLRVRMEAKIRLSAPAPNPISDEARFSFSVKQSEETTVRLFDVLGQQVATLYWGLPAAGKRVRVRLDSRGLASGTYVIRLRAGGATKTQKVTVVQ